MSSVVIQEVGEGELVEFWLKVDDKRIAVIHARGDAALLGDAANVFLQTQLTPSMLEARMKELEAQINDAPVGFESFDVTGLDNARLAALKVAVEDAQARRKPLVATPRDENAGVADRIVTSPEFRQALVRLFEDTNSRESENAYKALRDLLDREVER